MAKQQTGRTIEWTTHLDNRKYRIKAIISSFGGRHKIYVNDELVPFTGNAFISWLAGFDQRLPIEGHDVYIFGRGSKVELAVDGKVRGDKKAKFQPMPPTPKWLWIFNLLLVFLVPLGQFRLIPFILAFGGILLCTQYAHKPKPENERLVTTLMVFILVVALFFVAGMFTSTIDLWFLPAPAQG